MGLQKSWNVTSLAHSPWNLPKKRLLIVQAGDKYIDLVEKIQGINKGYQWVCALYGQQQQSGAETGGKTVRNCSMMDPLVPEQKQLLMHFLTDGTSEESELNSGASESTPELRSPRRPQPTCLPLAYLPTARLGPSHHHNSRSRSINNLCFRRTIRNLASIQ